MATPTEEMNPILAAAQASATAVAASAATSKEKSAALSKRQEKATDVIKKSVADVGLADQIIALTADNANLKAQNDTLRIVNASDTIPAMAEFQRDLVETGQELVATQNEVEAIHNEYSDGFFNAIVRDFKLIGPTARMEAAQERVSNLNAIVSNVSASTESVQRAVNTTRETLTTATIQANQTKFTSANLIEQNKAELASIKLNAEAMDRDRQRGAAELVARVQVNALRTSEEALKIQQEGAAQRKIKFEQDQELFKEREEGKTQRVIATNKGQALVGLPVEERAFVLSNEGRSQKERWRYNTLREIGITGTLGSSFGDAVTNILGLKPPESPVTKLPMELYVEYVDSKVSARQDMPEPNTPEFTQELNKFAKDKMKVWSENILSGSGAINPLHAEPFPALVDAYDSIKNDKLYKDHLAPLEMQEFDLEKIYDTATAAVVSGTLSIEDATAGIETIMAAAMTHNNNTKRFEATGLGRQSTYRTQVYGGKRFTAGAKGAAVGIGVAGAGAVSKRGLGKGKAALLIGAGGYIGSGIANYFDNTDEIPDMASAVNIKHLLTVKLAEARDTDRGLFE